MILERHASLTLMGPRVAANVLTAVTPDPGVLVRLILVNVTTHALQERRAPPLPMALFPVDVQILVELVPAVLIM